MLMLSGLDKFEIDKFEAILSSFLCLLQDHSLCHCKQAMNCLYCINVTFSKTSQL